MIPPIGYGPSGYPREYGNPRGVSSDGDTSIVSPSLPSTDPSPMPVPIAAIAADAADCSPLPIFLLPLPCRKEDVKPPVPPVLFFFYCMVKGHSGGTTISVEYPCDTMTKSEVFFTVTITDPSLIRRI